MGWFGKSREEEEAERLLHLRFKATATQLKVLSAEVGQVVHAVNDYVSAAVAVYAPKRARKALLRFHNSEGADEYPRALRAVEKRIADTDYVPLSKSFARLIRLNEELGVAAQQFATFPSLETDEELSVVMREMMGVCGVLREAIDEGVEALGARHAREQAEELEQALDAMRDTTHTAFEFTKGNVRAAWRRAVDYVGEYASPEDADLVHSMKSERKRGAQLKLLASVEQNIAASGYIPVRQHLRKVRRLARRVREAYDEWHEDEGVELGTRVVTLCTKANNACGELQDVVGGPDEDE